MAQQVVDEREELATVPLERLEAEITELAGHLAAAECRWLLMVAEFDRREGWLQWGCRTCAHWLSWQCGLDLRSAQEKVRVARSLTDLPLVREQFGRGALTYSKARAITRVATPANEAALVELALHATAAQIERITRAYRGVLDADDELAAANERHERRYLCWWWDDDGSLVVHGRLAPEAGALLLEAVHAGVDSTAVAEPGPSAQGERSAERREGIGARRADALVAIAETFLATGPAAGTGGDRYQVVVHVEAETLGADAGECCSIEDGPALAPETARRLACDSSVVPIHLDADGEPLNVGRKTRTIPPALRRALRARDGGCRFPGCTERRFVDGHHVRHWAHGGETSLANLVELCRFHHRLVHEGGYTLRLDERGAVRVRAKAGHDLEPIGTGVGGGVAAGDGVMVRNLGRGVVVTPDTCKPTWYGDPLDLDHAITGLLCVDGRADGDPSSRIDSIRLAS